jgi:hypothetical protein
LDFVAVKDFLSDKGIIAFHDSNSWLSVMKAINIISEDEVIKKSFRMYVLWKDDGILLLERNLNEKLVPLEILVRDST